MGNWSDKRKLKKEIKVCMQTIEEIERKRSRSQSALVQAEAFLLCAPAHWILSSFPA